ncbi:MAG: hypothetical protein IIX12_02565 [Alistipes sp.]|nr:hypothetical protein [Alistipes sp.]
MKNATYIAALVVAFFLGQLFAQPDVVEVERVEYDTIVRTVVVADTVERVKVVYRNLPSVEVVRTDTLVVRDTVRVAVPISRYTFSDSLYRCEVEGYEVSLKRMEVFPRTVYRTTIVREPSRWGVGVQVGYGLSREGLSPYVGVGVNYNLISF